MRASGETSSAVALNDVWESQDAAQSWELRTASAWSSGRYHFAAAVLAAQVFVRHPRGN